MPRADLVARRRRVRAAVRRGQSVPQIAAALGLTRRQVQHDCHVLGITAPSHDAAAPAQRRRAVAHEHARAHDPKQPRVLTPTMIGEVLGVDAETVKRDLRALGLTPHSHRDVFLARRRATVALLHGDKRPATAIAEEMRLRPETVRADLVAQGLIPHPEPERPRRPAPAVASANRAARLRRVAILHEHGETVGEIARALGLTRQQVRADHRALHLATRPDAVRQYVEHLDRPTPPLPADAIHPHGLRRIWWAAIRNALLDLLNTGERGGGETWARAIVHSLGLTWEGNRWPRDEWGRPTDPAIVASIARAPQAFRRLDAAPTGKRVFARFRLLLDDPDDTHTDVSTETPHEEETHGRPAGADPHPVRRFGTRRPGGAATAGTLDRGSGGAGQPRPQGGGNENERRDDRSGEGGGGRRDIAHVPVPGVRRGVQAQEERHLPARGAGLAPGGYLLPGLRRALPQGGDRPAGCPGTGTRPGSVTLPLIPRRPGHQTVGPVAVLRRA